MRPWKIYKKAMDDIKKNAANDEEWAKIAADNWDRLQAMFSKIGMSEKVLSDPIKTMWR